MTVALVAGVVSALSTVALVFAGVDHPSLSTAGLTLAAILAFRRTRLATALRTA